jgi:hypothetical protein
LRGEETNIMEKKDNVEKWYINWVCIMEVEVKNLDAQGRISLPQD